jgi:hypothetical protein
VATVNGTAAVAGAGAVAAYPKSWWARQTAWYHNGADGLDHYVIAGGARDFTADNWLVTNLPGLLSPAAVSTGCVKLALHLAGKPRGWEA